MTAAHLRMKFRRCPSPSETKIAWPRPSDTPPCWRIRVLSLEAIDSSTWLSHLVSSGPRKTFFSEDMGLEVRL